MNVDTVKTIREVVGQIDYEKIILFGSQATGRASNRSDHDLMIILKETLSVPEKMRLSAFLRREFARKGIDADIIIKSNTEVEYYRHKIGNVVKSAMQEGIAI